MDDRPGLPSVAAERQHEAYMRLVARHRRQISTATALVALLGAAVVALLVSIAVGWVRG